MDDFYVLFNSISVTSGWLVGENERLHAMDLFAIENISASGGARTLVFVFFVNYYSG